VKPAVLTQAFTWLNSGSAAGIALGAAFAGQVVDTHNAHYGFLVALGASLLALLMAVAVHRVRPEAKSMSSDQKLT
jgi:predicted MFS family arabinose efflux permease